MSRSLFAQIFIDITTSVYGFLIDLAVKNVEEEQLKDDFDHVDFQLREDNRITKKR